MSEIDEVKVDDIEEPGAEPTDESTDWKAEALKARGIAKRNATRLEKLKKAAATKVETVGEPVKTEKKAGFDYAEKAFLKANGIATEEYAFVQEVMQSTGKTLDEVLEAKYFQSELKERRDEKTTKDAIPSGTKRSTSSTRDTTEYWIEKGTLPPDKELARKVVAERIRRATQVDVFSKNPIV